MVTEYVDYDNTHDVRGSSESHFVVNCSYADRLDVCAGFLWALDGNDTTLQCYKTSWKYLAAAENVDDILVQVRADFMPAWKLQLLMPDQPFKVRYEYGSQSFTISGKGYVWADDNSAIENENILPLKVVDVKDVVLYGSRSSFDSGTFSGYEDRVNNATFLGAPAGCVLFRGASATPRQLETGTMTWDVEVKLSIRQISWNMFYREKDGTFQEIKQAGSGNKMFPAVGFGGLLA